MTRPTSWLLLTLLATAASAAEAPAITVHVLDLAGVPEAVLSQAMRVTASIYEKAGVSLRWVKQPDVVVRVANGKPFRLDTPPNELSVWLLPKEFSRKLADPGDPVAGMADTGPRFQTRTEATIFYDRVAASASSHPDLKLPSLLGILIAHELGHLFLGAGAHEKRTVMTVRWDKEDSRSFLCGQLSFSPEQSARMQANAADRFATITKPARTVPDGF